MPSLVSATNLLEQYGVGFSTDSEYQGLGVAKLLTTSLSDVWRAPGRPSTDTGDIPVVYGTEPVYYGDDPVTYGTVGGSFPGAPDGFLTASVAIDLRSVQPAQVVALAAPRDAILPYAGSRVRLRASSADPNGADELSLDLDLAMPRGYWLYALPAPVAARYWLITILVPAGQPYLQFGRLWLGQATVLAPYLAEGDFEPALSDDPHLPVRRSVQFVLPSLTQDQADAIEDLALTLGTQRQGLFVPRLERAARSAIFGKMTSLPAPRPRVAWSISGSQRNTATIAALEDR